MAAPSTTYEPRCPAQTALYQIVRDHVETFRVQKFRNRDLCRGVVAVFVRAVLGFLRACARHDGVVDGRGGAVAVIQRFGGALNLNVHVHALVFDGAFAKDGFGVVRFRP